MLEQLTEAAGLGPLPRLRGKGLSGRLSFSAFFYFDSLSFGLIVFMAFIRRVFF